MSRQGVHIKRTFSDAIYGGELASLTMAKAYRDALIRLIPPQSQRVPRRFVWNLTARIHRSGARWGLWATRQSELSTNPPGGAFC